MYTGTIVKETLKDELVLDNVVVDEVQLWKTDSKPKYWTMLFFHSQTENLPELLSAAVKDGWYADMKDDATKYIVFSDAVYSYSISDASQKAAVIQALRERGVPESQLDWSE